MSGSELLNWTMRGDGPITRRVPKLVVMLTVAVATIVVSAENAAAQQGVINLDETVIKGRIQKPEAFYILQHANLNYESLDPKPTFIPELLATVREEPF